MEVTTGLGTLEQDCKATQAKRKTEQHLQKVLITQQHRNSQRYPDA